ncbi:prepilin-type N-terminal cleavage/methylation domain-containing protein [Psychrobacter lutiphocae]|uniref:prepilin-type N-terminal cleavage/methylation domain-containing protein n=1 Tax=Psychrobacter lutiphocae TaxID=540500 RepID=UPI001427CBE5|nr:prepilin-type N-terminal cleavage/methylation domain-containing protein [Psychrobacter lutiphocae]
MKFFLIVNSRPLAKRQTLLINGFSLIELMIVVMIMALIAVIVLPSYQSHLRHKWQTQAQQQGLLVANQLARWQSKRLSYAGFMMMPASNMAANRLENRGKQHIPIDSNDEDYYYLLTLRDATGQLALNQLQANGNGWRLLIAPNPKQTLVQVSDTYYLDSLGQRCRFGPEVGVLDISTQIDCSSQPGW